MIDKIKSINEEKNNFIQENQDKRNKIVLETETFVREIQEKYENEIPEKHKAIEENQNLRKEIELTVQDTIKHKEELESQIKSLEKEGLVMEEAFRNNLKSQMENATTKAQTLLLENSQLSNEIASLELKEPEIKKAADTYETEYAKLQYEIEKKKQEILLLSKENIDLQIKIKKTFSKEAFEAKYKTLEKTKNQLTMMKSLNKKLHEKIQEN